MTAVIDTHWSTLNLCPEWDFTNATPGANVIELPAPDTVTQTEDVDRNPYLSATLTFPRPSEAVMQKLDPRNFPVIRLRLNSSATVTNHEPALTSDVSAAVAPGTVADLSADFAGTTATMSQAFPGDDIATVLTPGLAASTRQFAQVVTEVTEDIAGSTVTVTLSGVEVLLDYWANISPLPADMSGYGSIPNIVAEVCRRVGIEAPNIWGGGLPVPATADAMYWQPGQSARDFIDGLLEFNDQRIYGTNLGVLYVAPTGTVITSGFPSIDLDYRNGMTNASRSLAASSSRNEYFDAVLVLYRWKNSAGVDQLAFDRYPNSSPYRKALVLNRDRPFPGAGAAQAIYNRTRKRGGDYNISVVSRYDVTSGWASTLRLPADRIAQATSIKGISWTLPKAEMTLRLEMKEG